MIYYCCFKGERHATINLHYLLHLTEMVKDLGPLWANTCFEFESANHTIKKLFHGTKKIDMQVMLIHVHGCTLYQVIFKIEFLDAHYYFSF